MKRLFHGAIIGIAVGVMIALICSTIFARNEFHPVSPVSTMGEYYFQHLSELQIMFISVIIWSLIGITFSFGDLIFSNSKKSLLFKTSLHFSLMLIIMLPLAILAGWFPLKISAILFFIIIYTVVYFMIWFIETKRNQHDINEINDIISKRKHNRHQ
ncbi:MULTISPECIES: DUF3021 domain-containing protein [Staphylococcus]|jgi:hypothetical protein|uniref:DUF3021 domain-containing protein n=1 Tax=Staphylococcus nepalensis TaxID=214473 RepID=A0A2T4SDZ4_9STAP|nr:MULTISPECIES: DUF3021 domain-containing protein [Staphylococcus]MBO1206069.1 DUF3021 domain-containing protein [Staphylococcus nepalensis]MBO1214744.1 DUF3021 domain-containing protein [Staphylococcus nepalensis]MBO1216776.1 DUF3021 domain-containing protein [Staphylococcus nepalensis]MBO1227479.1 DUF3021 domain-containing protein [Staphylococcus nepalensis]MBO1235558.1 DUF3021 domain-containing protein [Staphylococcus nepalensis]